MVRILEEHRVIRIRLSGKDIFGPVIGLRSGRRSHTDQERGKVAASYPALGGLARSTGVKSICAGGSRRLTDIEVSAHVFESRREHMLAPRLRQCHVEITVLAGKLKRVPVCRTADTAAHIIEIHIRQSLVNLLS